MAIRRNSLRYPGYDYRQAGAVFVTICTHQRQPIFGSVIDGVMTLSAQGEVAEQLWLGIEERFPGVVVDSTVIMPDHLHGILMLGTDPGAELHAKVGDLVHWFKIKVQAAYRKQVAAGVWPPYRKQLWQRNFHDRIIRNDCELDQIRDYIVANPARWTEKRKDT